MDKQVVDMFVERIQIAAGKHGILRLENGVIYAGQEKKVIGIYDLLFKSLEKIAVRAAMSENKLVEQLQGLGDTVLVFTKDSTFVAQNGIEFKKYDYDFVSNFILSLNKQNAETE